MFRNVLVATDFGESSDTAVDYACDLARASGAPLTIAHVWSVPYPAYVDALSMPTVEIQRAAREALEQEAERIRRGHGAGLEVSTLLVAGSPWRALVEAAGEHGFDLLVLGTHGRQGLGRLGLGSVAERVVRYATVPVLTVRGSEATGAT